MRADKKMCSMKFTIFTGCYNSSGFIHRVFKSLKDQTYKDFEWIVIDDASKDNTVELINIFIKDNPEIDIKFIALKENLGVAQNRRRAIQMANGDYFVTWDHDDEQLPEQLSIFKQVWDEYDAADIANIFSFCMSKEGLVLGGKFPMDRQVSNYFRYYQRFFMTNKVKQEKHVCTKVKIIQQYIDFKFDEGRIIDGEMLWAKIATKYRSVFINDVLRVYYIEDSNKNNMSSKTRSQMANSVYYQKTIWVNNFYKYLRHEPLLQLRLLFSKVLYGTLSGHGLAGIIKSTKGLFKKTIVLSMFLPAKVLSWKLK